MAEDKKGTKRKPEGDADDQSVTKQRKECFWCRQSTSNWRMGSTGSTARVKAPYCRGCKPSIFDEDVKNADSTSSSASKAPPVNPLPKHEAFRQAALAFDFTGLKLLDPSTTKFRDLPELREMVDRFVMRWNHKNRCACVNKIWPSKGCFCPLDASDDDDVPLDTPREPALQVCLWHRCLHPGAMGYDARHEARNKALKEEYQAALAPLEQERLKAIKKHNEEAQVRFFQQQADKISALYHSC